MAENANTEKELANLDDTLRDITINMRVFSLCMRSLYSDKSVGSGSPTARKVSKLRDDTKKDAMVYVKGILPISTSLVRSIREFFEYYEDLDIEEWKENLPDILHDVRGYKQSCTEVVRLHRDILIPLKKRQDEAAVLMGELTELSAEYERKKQALKASATTKREWAVALAFVPGINVIASPFLAACAEMDLAESVAKGVRCQIHESAALVVGETMIPALAAFINGLDAVAGFFTIIENELISFHAKGEKAKESAKTLHYKMVKKKAKSIGDSCQRFYAMIPGVKTDLMSIPDTGTDDNYVDKWLKKQRNEIEGRYGAKLTGQMKRMMPFLSLGGTEHLMLEGHEGR